MRLGYLDNEGDLAALGRLTAGAELRSDQVPEAANCCFGLNAP